MKKNLVFLLVFLSVSWSAHATSSDVFHSMTLLFLGAYIAAKVLGVISEKLGLPSLVGEILGGILLGNLVYLGVDYNFTEQILQAPFFQYASELGVIFLLFLVGLESNLSDLKKVGFNSTVTAVIGVIIPTILGYVASRWLGIGNSLEAWLIGATFAATSVGITAKMLSENQKIKTKSAQIILGAAVVDDVIGLILLATLAGVAATGEFHAGELVWILVKIILFFVFALVFGHFVLPHTIKWYQKIHKPALLTALSVLLALAFADVAYLVGLAPIVGAFTAGLLLDDFKLQSPQLKTHDIAELIQPITDFLLPIFFVTIGVQVNLSTLLNLSHVYTIFFLLILALFGKMVCGFACRGEGVDRFGIGLGMIPRGEVGLIFATFGLKANIITTDLYSILVFVVLLTTILGPIFLKPRLKNF